MYGKARWFITVPDGPLAVGQEEPGRIANDIRVLSSRAMIPGAFIFLLANVLPPGRGCGGHYRPADHGLGGPREERGTRIS
jgi:hypothetical protein